MTTRIQSNRVVFTLNNPTDEELEQFTAHILEQIDDQQNLRENAEYTYAVVGEEMGEVNGTHHLQGFLHRVGTRTDARSRGLRFWKRTPGLTRAHFERARGSDQDSEAYCKKDGMFIEIGEPAGSPTTVYAKCIAALQEEPDLRTIVERFPEESVKHFSNLKQMHTLFDTSIPVSAPEELRPWQRRVVDMLQRQNDRQILFCVDPEGGMGKSSLARWLMRHENAHPCDGGKETDLKYAFNPAADIVVFDFAKNRNLEFLPWNFMESIKNGWFTNYKYHSRVVTFTPPKVVVFMNEDPPRDKFSADRYQVIYIRNLL